MMILNLLLCSTMALSSGATFPGATIMLEERVALYSTVRLSCTFPFVNTFTGLTVIWKKEGNKTQKELILYKLQNGVEKPEEPNPRYRGRVELSKDVTQGDLHLTLRNVTYEDEGTYECRAANQRRNGNKKVTLSIDRLDADDPKVTLVTIDQKRRMKCIGRGKYAVPQVQWITSGGEDLSLYGRCNVTEQSNGWTLVESVLQYDLEANTQVLCHITEGRLRRSTRAIISDGAHPVVVDGAHPVIVDGFK